MRTPTDNATAAAEWAKSHPTEWSALLTIFSGLPRKGAPFTRDTVYTELAMRRLNVTDNEDFMRDHNMYAALLRYAIILDPTVGERAHLRKSAYDDIDMVHIWEVVWDGEVS